MCICTGPECVNSVFSGYALQIADIPFDAHAAGSGEKQLQLQERDERTG